MLGNLAKSLPGMIVQEVEGGGLRGVMSVRHWLSNPNNIPKIFQKPKVSLDRLSKDEPVSGSADYFDDITRLRKFDWTAESLNAKGFLRYQKAYKPPPDAREKVLDLAKSIIPKLERLTEDHIMKFKFADDNVKFHLLSESFTQFGHSVPNSMLYMVRRVGDVVDFYTTEVKTSNPYEKLIESKDLPPNLHIQKRAHRYSPETDGLTAFPKNSTLVTGLRSKKIYKGYDARPSWI